MKTFKIMHHNSVMEVIINTKWDKQKFRQLQIIGFGFEYINSYEIIHIEIRQQVKEIFTLGNERRYFPHK